MARTPGVLNAHRRWGLLPYHQPSTKPLMAALRFRKEPRAVSGGRQPLTACAAPSDTFPPLAALVI